MGCRDQRQLWKSLGDHLQECLGTKLADGLYCGGETPEELLRQLSAHDRLQYQDVFGHKVAFQQALIRYLFCLDANSQIWPLAFAHLFPDKT